MGHTYCDNLLHVVFSTKGRRRFDIDRMSRLWKYVGGIARSNGFTAIAIGGVEDHLHILLSLPSTISVAKAVQLMKGGSSKWFNEQYPSSGFAWQQGFAAFSVSRSQAPKTIEYILNQAEHHERRDFRGEFIALLERHGVAYDPMYVLG